MKILLSAMLASLVMMSSAMAFDTPEALLKALYAPYTKGPDFDWANWDETVFRSSDLNALFAKDAKESGGIGRLDFDPYIDGQDYQISALKIGEPQIDGNAAKVDVSFRNFDAPDTLTFMLVREDEGWKIDDVVNAGKDFPYSLRKILAAPLD